jgi:hypothetical protein
MKETELIGKLLPGHPDIFPIIESIREKYFIPPVDPEDDIGAILLNAGGYCNKNQTYYEK